MARDIQQDFEGRELVVISLLNGTVMFLADLVRCLSLPLRLDFIGVSSYGAGTQPGDLVFTKDLRLDVRGRDVLLVDDFGESLRPVLAGDDRVHGRNLDDTTRELNHKVTKDTKKGVRRWLPLCSL